MALSKKELNETFTQHQLTEILFLEGQIDKELLEKWTGEFGHDVVVPLPYTPNMKIQKELIRRYRAKDKSWVILSFSYDENDGPFLWFR